MRLIRPADGLSATLSALPSAVLLISLQPLISHFKVAERFLRLFMLGFFNGSFRVNIIELVLDYLDIVLGSPQVVLQLCLLRLLPLLS